MADAGERLRHAVRAYGGDLWSLIDDVVSLAAERNNAGELRARRDGIVARLYAPAAEPAALCRRCGARADEVGANVEVEAEQVEESEGDDVEEEQEGGDGERDDGGDDDGMVNKIIAIREFIEDPDEPEDSLVSLLQNLADMNITYRAIQATDIGKCVNGLRKHPSGEVRSLVKLLVRKWKDVVEEWVQTGNADGATDASPVATTKSDMTLDADSPPRMHNRNHQNTQKVPETHYSRSPQNGTMRRSERDGSVPLESRPKPELPRRETIAPSKTSTSSIAGRPLQKSREPTDMIDSDRLNSARKRLHENYQEAENAKKQRTIQVMDIHEIPKTGRNTFIRRGGGPPRHHHHR